MIPLIRLPICLNLCFISFSKSNWIFILLNYVHFPVFPFCSSLYKRSEAMKGEEKNMKARSNSRWWLIATVLIILLHERWSNCGLFMLLESKHRVTGRVHLIRYQLCLHYFSLRYIHCLNLPHLDNTPINKAAPAGMKFLYNGFLKRLPLIIPHELFFFFTFC